MIPSPFGYCPRCDDRVEFVPVAGGEAMMCCRCDSVRPTP